LFGVLFFSFVITFLLTLSPWIQRRVDAALFVFPAIMASTGVLTALDAILRYNPSVLGLSGLAERLENNRLLSLGISSVPAFLVCAMCAGYFYGPALLDKTKNSRIDCDIEEHRPGEINGKIIFLLSRHVIVLSKGSVVAIANEKVHSIETPPLAR
jgi:hypothetical protein